MSMRNSLCILVLFICCTSGLVSIAKKRFIIDTLHEIDCSECKCQDRCHLGGKDAVKARCEDLWDKVNCSQGIQQFHVCDNHDCSGHGSCYEANNAPACHCDTGFTGNNCETMLPTVITTTAHVRVTCFDNPCKHGSCVNGLNGYRCTCSTGWSGTDCDQVSGNVLSTQAPDNCASNPCVRGNCSNTSGGYQCACPAGSSGQNCEIAADACKSDPCKHGGTCLNLNGIFACVCTDEWSGVTCEEDATPVCDHLCPLEAVAKAQPKFSNGSAVCSNSYYAANEALTMTCCKLGPSDTWKKGLQVMGHCGGTTKIPAYTPIASYLSGRPRQDTSGVFLDCNANGFSNVSDTGTLERTVASGGWCAEKSIEKGHMTDKEIIPALAAFFKGKRVASFGDGPGRYKQLLLATGLLKGYDAYDGAPFSEKTSEGRVQYLDLTIPQYGLPLYDWVMSLEVAEHIPKEYESIFLDNIVRHAKEGIVLSWAKPGQGGFSHINNQPFSYVKSTLRRLGFVYDLENSTRIQEAANLTWLKQNTNVYWRNDTDELKIRELELFWT